jgi:hypothetical protein
LQKSPPLLQKGDREFAQAFESSYRIVFSRTLVTKIDDKRFKILKKLHCMNTIQKLIQDVSTARKSFLDKIANVTEIQAQWKPEPEVWNITEITEHLFWAEHGGIIGMWKTLYAIRDGKVERNYESIHKNMPIEQVIDMTWKPKEIVPAVAAPRLGGPLFFWKLSLNGLQEVLGAFGQDLEEDELRLQAHSHPISGALDFQQRLEFLRFHFNRHKEQVSQLLTTKGFEKHK